MREITLTPKRARIQFHDDGEISIFDSDNDVVILKPEEIKRLREILNDSENASSEDL